MPRTNRLLRSWALMVAALLVATACEERLVDQLPTARANARCTANGAFARTSTEVVQCRRGRYRPVMTVNRAKQLVREATNIPPPLPVVDDGTRRIMVVGDSFAMSLVPGMSRLATSDGTFEVTTAGIPGCGVGRGGLTRGIGLEGPWSAGCQNRDAFLRTVLRDRRHAVAVVAGGMWDVTDRQLPGDNAWRTVGDARYELYLIGEILHLVDLLLAEGVRVVWTTSPHWDTKYTPTLYMGLPPYPETEPARTDRLNELFRLALAQRPQVTLVDLAEHLRAIPGGEFGPGVRDDAGVHLNDAGSDAAARWLLPQLG